MASVSQPAFDFNEPEPTKHCNKCDEWKPLAAFGIDRRRPDGRFPCCKRCRSRCPEQFQPRPEQPAEKLLHNQGYVLVWAKGHPRAHGGRIFEHILVMEAKLGRYLKPDEHVHHKDRNRLNNDPDNLELTTNSEHGKIHGEELAARRFTQVEIACQECGKLFSIRRSRGLGTRPEYQRKYCSRACYLPNWTRMIHEKRKAKLGY